jgi:hypothetical protein
MDMMARPSGLRSYLALLIAATAGAALLSSGGTAARAATDASDTVAGAVHWGQAEQVPGVAKLNTGFSADVQAIACWGAGGCAAGGYYTDRHHHGQVWVALERKGRWGTAEQIPGTATLNQGGNARVSTVSCAHTTACTTVGTFTDRNGNTQWFTVTERNLKWATAAQVPDPALNQAAIGTVWCAAGGLCAAGGQFTDSSGAGQAWVRTEVSGRWQSALEVPGIAPLNTGNNSDTAAMSCASTGNCAAGGGYTTCTCITDNGFPPVEAFVVTETNGTWGTAQEVPGIQNINVQEAADAATTLMTCPSAGNCTAAGYYESANLYSCDPPWKPGQPEPPPFPGCGAAFAVNERDGTWGAVTGAGLVQGASLACPAAGDCVTAGDAQDYPETETGGLMDETNDRWGAVLQLNSTTTVSAVSCASPGYCSGGGSTRTGSAFVISEWHGIWGKVFTPTGVLRGPAGTVSAMACPPKITRCVAGGSYQGPKGGGRAFLVSQTG